MTLGPEGFTTKRLPQLKSELEQSFRDGISADLNFGPETVIGQIVGIESEARSITWADLEDVYQSQYPATASGVQLDRVVNLNGLTRLPALPTTVTAVMDLVDGTAVGAGAKASAGGSTYTLTALVVAAQAGAYGATVSVGTVTDGGTYTVTIGGVDTSITAQTPATVQNILTDLAGAVSGDTVIGQSELEIRYDGPSPVAVSANLAIDSVFMLGQFQADETGPNPLPVGALDEIETPVSGWLGVTNEVEGTLGRNVETDADLRIRREQAVRLQAVNTVDSITANLRALDGVLDALVNENTGTTTDGDGLPPQHIWAIVEGGTDADIGEIIYTRKAAGIGTFGTDFVDVPSPVTGALTRINYQRPTVTPVYVTVTIDDAPGLPTDYVDRVRAALVAYSGMLGIGEDLIRNRLFGPVYTAIDGQSFVTQVTLDTSPSPVATANIAAGTTERLTIASGDVNVLLA